MVSELSFYSYTKRKLPLAPHSTNTARINLAQLVKSYEISNLKGRYLHRITFGDIPAEVDQGLIRVVLGSKMKQHGATDVSYR